jgi:hypothetical protein
VICGKLDHDQCSYVSLVLGIAMRVPIKNSNGHGALRLAVDLGQAIAEDPEERIRRRRAC